MVKEHQFVSVVAYVHNEADKIVPFVTTIKKACEQFRRCEIIFVDDFSTDNSVDTIKHYFDEFPTDYTISIIKLGKYHGLERAINAGRDMAIGDYIFEFDDIYVDYEQDVILEAYKRCLEGNDIVTASTDVPIRFTSKLFYYIFNKSMESDTKVGQESFRVLSRRGINRIISMNVDIPYRKAVYLNCGLSSASITYKSSTGIRPIRDRKKDERFELAFDSFIYFTNIMQRVAITISMFFCILSVCTILYTIISRLMGYHQGMGWVSTMIFMSLGFAGLFGVLVIIIKYLSVLIEITFKQQKYMIRDIEKITSV